VRVPVVCCGLLLAVCIPASACAAAPIAITAESPASSAAWGPGTPPVVRASLPLRGAAFTVTVVRQALRYLGRPYKWSGIGAGGFDCSGLVVQVFTALGMPLPHSSSGQYQAGTAVPAALLGPGDLVFFHTYTSGPSHVGIYLGARRFIHASVSRGVIVSSMDEPYYRTRYLGARRY
jgi:cell wall-associated NlpC family hydrolase